MDTKNYILLPGYHSPGSDNFYPWLIQKLASGGALTNVVAYNSLIDDHSEQEIMDYISANAKLDENTVLIGHSLGGALAMKLLERSNTKIAKLVLVAAFATPKFKDKQRSFEHQFSWEFNFEAIKKNAGEIIILTDRTDFIVPESAAMELQQKLGGTLVIFTAISSHVKGEKEPSVLEAIQGSSDKAGRIVLMHGKDRGPGDTWYPWLKMEAEKKNIGFMAPELPKTNDPVTEEWVQELEKTKPDENTILVGHSRGGVAILRWLEKLPPGKKVKKAILIAANRGSDGGRDYDYAAIKQHAGSFVVFHSTEDKWVPYSTGQYNADSLQAKFYSFNDRGHFGTGNESIPELLLEI